MTMKLMTVAPFHLFQTMTLIVVQKWKNLTVTLLENFVDITGGLLALGLQLSSGTINDRRDLCHLLGC